jgi:hypothetical protein
MLASITPLGQRGTIFPGWAVTVTAFLLAAVVAGAALGAALGGLGGLALPHGLGDRGRLLVLALAALAALALDAGPARVPGPRRQVDERWRARYRGWVYGLGYGTQLGLGVATIVSSAATYVALLAALLSGSVLDGALIAGLAGLVRGATPLLSAGVRRPEQLLALHRALDRWRVPAARLAAGALVGILAAALVAGLA